MTSNSRLKVAICGAGIGGLTCALALSKFPDIEIDVYESAGKLAEIGAGIGLFPRPWKIIRALGLEQDLLRVTEQEVTDGPASGTEKATSLVKVVISTSWLPTARSSCFIEPTINTRFYDTYQDPVERTVLSDSNPYCDVLLGADGLKSAVRRTLLGEKSRWAQSEGRYKEAAELMHSIDPVWSGTIAYRALIPSERLQARFPSHRTLTTPMQYLGKGGYVIAYPISQGKLVNFVAFTSRHDLENTKYNGPWVSSSDKSQFSSHFLHWEPQVRALIDCVDRPLQWAIHTVRPMRSYVSGRVAVMGDAAHAAQPHQCSGAGQAIEDGYILATVLGHPRTTRENVHCALRVYDEIRRPMAHRVQENTRQNGRYYSFKLDGIDLDRLDPGEQWDILQRMGKKFVNNWKWAWTTSIDDAVQEAKRRLES
uniref:FAD-binding domain-containing protein n=1 Tax=Moniliophthora roreri TaxID=221103 RepID=A0A0W0FYG3_MONRR